MYATDDGLVFDSFETKEEALTEFDGENVEFLTKPPRFADDLYYSYHEKKKVFIMEGKVKVPKAEKTVVKYII
jgi:hypothetical protein